MASWQPDHMNWGTDFDPMEIEPPHLWEDPVEPDNVTGHGLEGPVSRSLAPEDLNPTWDWLKGYKAYKCRRCGAEMPDDNCYVCGSPCDKKAA